MESRISQTVFPEMRCFRRTDSPRAKRRVHYSPFGESIGRFWKVRFLSGKIFQENIGFLPCISDFSGPLNRLNALLSLLHPLDHYRTPSVIGSAIGRPLFRPFFGGSPQPPRSNSLGGPNRAIVVLYCLKPL